MLYLGEILNIMESDTASQETIRRLEADLGVYKRAYADLDADRRRVERLKQETDKQKEDLENQLKVTNVSKFSPSHLMVAVFSGSSNHCTFGWRWCHL
jgi:chromosome segregation ATPase